MMMVPSSSSQSEAPLADDDALWERACDRRWEGKQGVARGELFWRGDYSRARLRPGEMKAILARRADHHGRARARG